VVLQPNQWTEVQVEVPKGRYNIIKRIETSWKMSLKNRGYVIPEIIGKKEQVKVWMKEKDRISTTIYKGTKIAQIWEADIIQKVCNQSNIANTMKEKKQINVDLTTNFDLTIEQQQKFRELLLKYRRLFVLKGRNLDQSSKVKHYIDTKAHISIRNKLRRTELYEEKIIRTEVSSMLKENIIRKSKSAWAAPVLLVDKPNKGVKFCVDYQKLNKITKKNIYLLPRIDNTLN
jgi:hypothetical protein